MAVFRIDDTEKLMKFATVVDFIGTKAAEINSHVFVAINFLLTVWRQDLKYLSKAAASGIILEKLLRYRQSDWRTIVAILRQEMSVSPRAGEYLEGWLRGHFLA